MEFKKYNSIENSYRQKMVDNINTYFPNATFAVQEKIHGANFSIWISETGDIRYAKRSGFIGENEEFYNYQRAMDRLSEEIQALKRTVLKTGLPLVIYGELCGGSYEGIDPIKGVKKVQRGVNYHPDVQFLAFDVVLDNELLNAAQAKFFLDSVEIPQVPFLTIGDLEDCLEYPNTFNSKVPKMFGLPLLKENIAEGTVIKLFDQRGVLPNGNRPILKNKNEKFSEKSKTKKPKTPTKTPTHLVEYVELLESLVNTNRLKNVLSKIGEINDIKSVFSKVMKPFSEDILEDFNKEAEGFSDLSKDDQKFVTSKVGKIASNLIRKNMGNIVDGEL